MSLAPPSQRQRSSSPREQVLDDLLPQNSNAGSANRRPAPYAGGLHNIVDKLKVCTRLTLAHGHASVGWPERQEDSGAARAHAGAARGAIRLQSAIHQWARERPAQPDRCHALRVGAGARHGSHGALAARPSQIARSARRISRGWWWARPPPVAHGPGRSRCTCASPRACARAGHSSADLSPEGGYGARSGARRHRPCPCPWSVSAIGALTRRLRIGGSNRGAEPEPTVWAEWRNRPPNRKAY